MERLRQAQPAKSNMPQTGQKSGRFEILRTVNRGGMGEIALGRVTGTKGFEKLVVLKRLRADAERDDHIAMFDVEQEVMSRIEHPNIVKVFDQPIIENTPYLAMEYVRGRNLDQIIRQAQHQQEDLSLALSLSVISEVLRGLAFVHRLKDNDGNALGVVHQDMTPSNVMVSFFGEVKITDFGISYVTSRDGGLRKGVLKGKPRYVAPEVLAGKRVNNRADIYGVGAVFYELLTSRALFARVSVKETLAAVARNELPDFSEEFSHLSSGVAKILSLSLKKDPQERYRTAEAMAADVLTELAKAGGAIPPATIGYQLRRLFSGDPDVPEMDPALEAAISEGERTIPELPMKPPSLDQTLEEIDRLLGPESIDVFTLPPELRTELEDLEDGAPFAALTPIPDFVWGAKDDAELLARASEAYKGDDFGGGAPNVSTETPKVLPQAPCGAEDDDEEHQPSFRPASRPESLGAYSQVKRKPGGENTGELYPKAKTEEPAAEARLPENNAFEQEFLEPSDGLSNTATADVRPPIQEPRPVAFWRGFGLGLGVGAALGAILLAFLT